MMSQQFCTQSRHLLAVAMLFTLYHMMLSSPVPSSDWSRIKRQGIFHCNGWGPGCVVMEDVSGPRGERSGSIESRKILGNLQLNGNSDAYASDDGANRRFEPSFFTSGSSWGAIGKRDPSTNTYLRRMLISLYLSRPELERKNLPNHFLQEYVRRQQELRSRGRLASE